MPIPFIVCAIGIAALWISGCDSEEESLDATLDAASPPDPEEPDPADNACLPYAGFHISNFPQQRYGAFSDNAKPEAVIPSFYSLPPGIQSLFNNPSEETLSSAIAEMSGESILVKDACDTLPAIGVKETYLRLYDAETTVDVTIGLLSLIAAAVGQADPEACDPAKAAHFLNNFLLVRPISFDSQDSIALNYSSIVNTGIKIFAHLLIKEIERRTNDFAQPSLVDDVPVATIQIDPLFTENMSDVEASIKRIAELTEEAAASGAKFIVTPELSVQGYAGVDISSQYQNQPNELSELDIWEGAGKLWCHRSVFDACPSSVKINIDDASDGYDIGLIPAAKDRVVEFVDASPVAIPADSPLFAPIVDAALRYGIYVQVGYMEKAFGNGEELIYNSVNVYGPSGALIYHHRKTKSYKAVDPFVFTMAELPPQPYFETPYGRISSAICYEGNSIFPTLSDNGVEIMLYSVAWVASKHSYTPNYQTAGEKVAASPMSVVMANWAFKDGPKVSLNVCPETQYLIIGNDAERNGSGLSYVMDSKGQLRGLLAGNPNEEILFATLPSNHAK